MEEVTSQSKKTILIVDDEKPIVDILVYNLQKEGYETLEANDGEAAIDIALKQKPDLILLDIMLPKTDGLSVCKRVRQSLNIPILMLSARDEEIDKILGLELGSDDYITKPYSSKELVLRVNNIIKRVYKTQKSMITYEDYTIDENLRIVREKEKDIILTTLEFDLLLLFLKNERKSFSREEILNSVWGDDYFGSDRVVDDLVRRLRKKMPKLKISAIYGYGYRL